VVRVHVGNGRVADARRLDDVDGVDADAGSDVARRRGVVPWHVGRNDGSDDAAVVGPNAVALPSGYRKDKRYAPRLVNALVGMGYFFVWTVFGVAVFPLGVTQSAIELRQPALARAAPIAVGAVVLIAGCLQFTTWKAHRVACCGESPGSGRTLTGDVDTAWRHGLRLGLHCGHCCASLMAILLVGGVMDLRVMAVVAAAITAERLAPADMRVARAIGAVVVGVGLFLIARAAGLA
jgi:predicted metal-binding membrane protein